jgi:hypothetical protein
MFTAAADAELTTLRDIIISATGPDGRVGSGLIKLSVLRPQVTVTRNGSGAGTVTSSPAGLNCGGGGACTAPFPLGTNVTLAATAAAASAFVGWSGGGCSGTNTTCTFTLTGSSTVTATFNSTAQTFSFAVTPTTASVPQGGSATATANITRVNGYAGAVSILATGMPSGLTATANPASVTDNTATLNLSATSAVAAGNYPITISATGAGIAGVQTATINVQVAPAPGGSGNVALSFANCDPSEVPVWVAAQVGTGAWARITPVNNTFTFAAGATNGIAMVRPAGTGFSTSVVYGTHDEITSLALGSPCRGLNASTGTKQLTGTIASVPLDGSAVIAVGGASTEQPTLQGAGYTLSNVPAGQRDLIAASGRLNANGVRAIQKLILRRNVNYTSSIPLLDFAGAESVAPWIPAIKLFNFGGDQLSLTVALVTANGASAPFYSRPVGANGATNGAGFEVVPDSLLQPGDLQTISITAAPANDPSFRLAILMRHTVDTLTADTVTLGPVLNQPTVTAIGTSPYIRLRAQLASQSAYSGGAHADFSQPANSVGVSVTAGYGGNTPANWIIDIPDLSSAGYDPAWGLKSGTAVNYQVIAVSGNFLPLLGATPVDGARVMGAGTGSTASAFGQRIPAKGW